MSNKLVALLADLEQRGKAMPSLLSQALHDADSLKVCVDDATSAANAINRRLPEQITTLTTKFGALGRAVSDEKKRQTGRLADASAGLSALKGVASQQVADLLEDTKENRRVALEFGTGLGALSKVLKDGVNNVHSAVNLGLGAVQKSQNRLATACTKLMGELDKLDQAVAAANQTTTAAVGRVLEGIKKAGEGADKGRANLATKATKDAQTMHTRMGEIHTRTVAPPTLTRTSQYVRSVQGLKSSATGAVYSVKSASEKLNTTSDQAAATFKKAYATHESNSNGQAAAHRESLNRSEAELDAAWKRIPLRDDGTKDTRSNLEKILHAPVYAAQKAWEAGVWAIKGVAKWVAENHVAIMIGIGVVAAAVVAVIFAPVVVPALMAGASAAIGAIGSGLTAGVTMAGSALAGVGTTLAGMGTAAASAIGTGLTSLATGLTGAGTSAWSAATALFAWPTPAVVTSTGVIPGTTMGAGWGWLMGGGAAGVYGYAKHGSETGDWTPKLENITAGLGVNIGQGGSITGGAYLSADTSFGSFRADSPTVNLSDAPRPLGTQPIDPETAAKLDALGNPELSSDERDRLEEEVARAAGWTPEARPVEPDTGVDADFGVEEETPYVSPFAGEGMSDATPLHDADAGGGTLPRRPKTLEVNLEPIPASEVTGPVFEVDGNRWTIDYDGKARLISDAPAGETLKDGDQLAARPRSDGMAPVNVPDSRLVTAVRNVLGDTHKVLDNLSDSKSKLTRIVTVYENTQRTLSQADANRLRAARNYLAELNGLNGRISALQGRAAHALQQFATRTGLRAAAGSTGFMAGPGGVVTEGIATAWSVVDGVATSAAVAGEATVEIPILYVRARELMALIQAL